MSASNDAASAWIRELVDGNEVVVGEFWQLYGESLQRLAASRMTPALRKRVGADDIVQSVCRTFFRRSREGQFELHGTASLWRLLCAITLTKVRQHARFHYQERRSINRERDPADGSADERAASEPKCAGPTPAEIVEFAEEIQRMFDALGDEERQFVQLRIEGLSQAEIAERLGCSERTVRRLLHRVKDCWEALLDESLEQA